MTKWPPTAERKQCFAVDSHRGLLTKDDLPTRLALLVRAYADSACDDYFLCRLCLDAEHRREQIVETHGERSGVEWAVGDGRA